MDIRLNDLLNFNDEEIRSAKIKFNIYDGNNDPTDLFIRNPDLVNTGWLFWNKKRKYFRVGQLAICFIKIDCDKWLLTTIKKVTKDLNVENGVSYEGEEIEKYKQFFGRVIVKYHKDHMGADRMFGEVCDKLIVSEILPNPFDGEHFPGYDRVRLNYEQLASIVSKKKKEWVTALSNQKAVYLIMDTHSGKLYVGSATGKDGMLLQRWSNYVMNGHGGNEGLKEVVEEYGFDYVKKNFQYSVLEYFNYRVDDEIILRRESWWKDTLHTREFGYNRN